MINSLLQAGAVPFGYTSDMRDSDPSVECITTEIIWPDYHIRGLASLPDVALSNTPLRRPHSYVTFPEKPCTEPAPAPPMSNLDTTPIVTPAEDQGRGVPARVASVNSVASMRRTVSTKLDKPQVVEGLLQNGFLHPYPYHHLPQLPWSLTHRHPPRHWGKRENDQQRRWRHTGEDLRRMADRFQLTNAKVARKNSSVVPPNLTIPEALTKCLSACLMCLVWWRLFNKFR
ncbi:uncharacterized protein [Panulirus ornatus]|uniref:uncharacterized protein isoform X2 n=1 Tax=Panulirus ornatus TaxID=150431 RepID=UPI003A858089